MCLVMNATTSNCHIPIHATESKYKLKENERKNIRRNSSAINHSNTHRFCCGYFASTIRFIPTSVVSTFEHFLTRYSHAHSLMSHHMSTAYSVIFAQHMIDFRVHLCILCRTRDIKYPQMILCVEFVKNRAMTASKPNQFRRRVRINFCVYYCSSSSDTGPMRNSTLYRQTDKRREPHMR